MVDKKVGAAEMVLKGTDIEGQGLVAISLIQGCLA
jgi:hypothetical protein